MLFLLFVIGLVSGTPQFLDFVTKYNKVYDNVELKYRLSVFLKNVEKIEELNRVEGKVVHEINQFADLTEEEFNTMHTGWIAPPESAYGDRVSFDNVTADDVDWRTKNAVTSVKNQGKCGSCWAFSAIQGVESLAFLSGKYDLLKMSAQQVNSCDKGSSGCNGGWPGSAFDYLAKEGGLETEADYPYTSGGGSTGSCKVEKSKIKEKVTGYSTAKKGEDSMLKALQDRPLSICHQTGGWSSYKSGTIMTSCGSGGGHCTQLIGYSSTQGGYWIIKNSWGTGWGTKGFIYIKKGSNLCGIANSPMYPAIA